ncbi:MAG TPA: hypothetical protein VNI78_00685 [Vicinamibacterales bacterium]|nr:hypothetical protein [Vicinamibacterales bacterium]
MALIRPALLWGWCLAALVSVGCMRSRAVEEDLRIVDVRTGWYDLGVVNRQNKLVPSITLRLQNVSGEPIRSVQLNAIFRRVGEQEAWGEHFVRAIGSDELAPGATGEPLVLRSRLGYTGEESRLKMLQNPHFVDAKVEIYGKHGSRTWVKMGEFVIDRQLLTE